MNHSTDQLRLERRVAALERELARTTRARRDRRRLVARAVGAATVVLLLGTAVAVAAPSVALTCPGGDLYCFDANTPAKANEVNHNFAQIKAWLEQKVGATGSAEVRVQTGLTSNVLAAAGKPLFVSGDIGASSNGVEIRRDDLTQGIGLGYNTIYATGNDDNQDLNLAAWGTGRVKTTSALDASDLYIGGTHIGTYIRDYIRSNCRIWVGWRDSCESCGEAPSRYSSILVGGTGCQHSSDQTWCNGSWAMVGFSGTMDANENIGVALVCD